MKFVDRKEETWRVKKAIGILVGECKWTTAENSRQLIAELIRKAGMLPFAENKKIVPVLSLKTKPSDYAEVGMLENGGGIILPEEIVALS